jgi:hypothetical protein
MVEFETVRPKSYKNIVGNRYGRLVVLELVGSKQRPGGRRDPVWHCHCDCGRQTTARGSSFRAGNTRSCGCLISEYMADRDGRSLPPGEAAFNEFYRSYEYGAQRRGYVFEIGRDEVRALSQKPCRYCGAEPEVQVRAGRRATAYNGFYSGNGLDRIDNTRGYVTGNVVACCAQCNSAKGTQTEAEFLAWAKRIADHQAERDCQ